LSGFLLWRSAHSEFYFSMLMPQDTAALPDFRSQPMSAWQYTFLAIRALIGGACPDDQDLQYSLHRLSSKANKGGNRTVTDGERTARLPRTRSRRRPRAAGLQHRSYAASPR